MTVDAILTTLALPDAARVDQRVPKKLLTEQGAPTTADKKAIQDGIEEIQWVSVLKPTTIGVPIYKDEEREYLEIAVIVATFRPAAKTQRLTELIHRAIPYPIILITRANEAVELSLAHKRASQSEKAAVVLDGPVCRATLATEVQELNQAFLATLRLANQPQQHLRALYQGWADCCAALAASRLTGQFSMPNSSQDAASRRASLDDHARLTREIAGFRGKAAKETQINRRVELNLAIQRLEGELAMTVMKLRGQG